MSQDSDSDTIMPAEEVPVPLSPSLSANPFTITADSEQPRSQSSIDPVIIELSHSAVTNDPTAQSQKGDEAVPLLPSGESTVRQVKYSTTPSGDIVGKDGRLKRDGEQYRSSDPSLAALALRHVSEGETLYNFVTTHGSSRPYLLLQCKGSHREWRTRKHIRYEDGKTITSTETYSEMINDFDFTIEASEAILPGSITWLVGDREATYRGRKRLEVDNTPIMVTEVEGQMVPMDLEAGNTGKRSTTWSRKATKSEKEASAVWRKRREDWGYAPWALIRGTIRGTEGCVESPETRYQLQYAANGPFGMSDDGEISSPSKTLRQWTDEYCASPKLVKDFTFQKVVHGWNMDSLRQAVGSAIRANYPHRDEPVVSIRLEASNITVQSNNWYTFIVSNRWILGFMWITAIFPLFIWPFKQFVRSGSGEWRVAGCAFALTKWEHLSDSAPGETAESYHQRTTETLVDTGPSAPATPLKATSKGVSKLVGESETQWLARWEETIVGYVKQGYMSSVPITQPLESFGRAGDNLDGRHPLSS
ncbi:hypothetical protein FRB96_007284 [Tulasnella sp. 330]|nr:hypothetical protein FRB96_007284 [Tulasnella sp. 330]